jgi:hypothetical protein
MVLFAQIVLFFPLHHSHTHVYIYKDRAAFAKRKDGDEGKASRQAERRKKCKFVYKQKEDIIVTIDII